MKKVLCSLICMSLFVSIAGVCPVSAQTLDITAAGAIVVDMNTGSEIYSENADKRLSMASTTKIMTALLLCENKDLNQSFKVTAEMVTVEGSSMGLLAGDTVHYRDLLYGMMLSSGNDAANATAIAIAGSLKEFAVMMNDRAAQIGMTNTNFVTPSGLDDDNHYTTARDMSKLAVTALKNELFAKAVSSRFEALQYGNPPYKRTLSNHNKLLRTYDGCCGVKTGFTKKSGRCLVSAAKRGNKGVVAVVLKDGNDWRDCAAMMDYAFEKLGDYSFGPFKTEVSVAGGANGTVACESDKIDISLLKKDKDRVKIITRCESLVIAPVERGEVVGTIDYCVGNTVVASSEMRAVDTVKIQSENCKRDFLFWLFSMFRAN